MVTRPRHQNQTLVRSIEELGGEAVVFPTIEILPLENYANLDAIIGRLRDYDWLVFTSANGVSHFLARAAALEQGANLRSVRIAAIGPQTARLLDEHGLRADRVPKEYRAEGILEAFTPEEVKGKRFLLARVAGARDILPRSLEEWGALVDVVETYRTVPVRCAAPLVQLLTEKGIDLVTLTSSSTVHALVDLLKEAGALQYLRDVLVACIGPITEKSARERGLRVDVVARDYTVEGLIHAILTYLEARDKGVSA